MSKPSFLRVCVTWATAFSVTGGTLVMTGCKTAALVGALAGAGTVAIIVIAKYKANAAQIAAAQQQVRAIYAEAAKPPSQRARVKNVKKRDVVAAIDPVVQPAVVKPEKPDAPPPAIPTMEDLDTSGARHLPHFLAVPVPRQNIPAEEGGKATYMVWDTHRQKLATDDVYVVNREVRAGAVVKLEGMKAKVAVAP